MKISHVTALVVSGQIWFLIGLMLLIKGLNFLVVGGHAAGTREQLSLLFIVIGLLLGFLKGKFVLSKTVKRMTQRILSFPNPIKLTQLYGPSYYLLIAGMMALGMSLKWIPVPVAFRGTVDVAIGSALMNGAILYFRSALALRKKSTPHL